RDLYLIKRKLRGVRGMPSHFFYFMGMHARSMPIDEQQADAFAAFVGPGLYGRNKEVSAIPIRNKSFRAIDHIPVALPPCGGFDVLHIRSGSRFRNGHGTYHI